MKFPILSVGSRFTWKGGEYEKVGPLSAVSLSDGVQRLMPCSADVRLAGSRADILPPPDPSPMLRREQVDEAIIELVQAAAQRFDDIRQGNPEQLALILQQLWREIARNRLST